MTYELPYSGEKYDIGSYDQDCCIYSKAEGSIASFTDEADDYPMKSVVAQIVPKQSGTGDPSPSNVRPISGWDSVVIEQRGKNLVDVYQYTSANIVSYPKVLKAGTYTASIFNVSNNYATYARKNDGTNPINGTQIATTQSRGKLTFTIAEDTEVIIQWYVPNDLNKMFPCQLELGSTATAYEPYQGSSYSIPFKDSEDNPITVYGGNMNITDGEGNDGIGMADLGDLNWAEEIDGVYSSPSLVGLIAEPSTPTETPNILCSKYKPASYLELWSQQLDNSITIIWSTSGIHGKIFVRDSTFTDPTAFKTAMQGVQLCYELATPTPIYCEPTEIKTLKGNNNIWCDTGDISVEYLAQLEKDTLPYSGQKYNVGNFEPIEGEESPHEIPHYVGVYEPIKEKSREGIEYIIL